MRVRASQITGKSAVFQLVIQAKNKENINGQHVLTEISYKPD